MTGEPEITHQGLCTVDGCPWPSDPDMHIPWCSHGLVGHHQHIPKRSQDTRAKIQAFICPRCHDKIDNGLWSNHIKLFPDGSVHYFILDEHGKTKTERVIGEAKYAHDVMGSLVAKTDFSPASPSVAPGEHLDAFTSDEVAGGLALPTQDDVDNTALAAVVSGDLAVVATVDLSQVSDEELANLYAWADKQQKDAFLTKCHIIYAYRERHVQHWGESWIEQAYQLFDGAPSRRTLQAYANIWQISDTSDANLQEHIGPLSDSRSLMQFIGRKAPEDGRVALEAAVAHLAEFGEPPTVPALIHRLGEETEREPEPPCPDSEDGRHHYVTMCSACGHLK